MASTLDCCFVYLICIVELGTGNFCFARARWEASGLPEVGEEKPTLIESVVSLLRGGISVASVLGGLLS